MTKKFLNNHKLIETFLVPLMEKYPQHAQFIDKYQIDPWSIQVYLRYNNTILELFQNSPKWDCTIRSSGFIKITRKSNSNITITLW